MYKRVVFLLMLCLPTFSHAQSFDLQIPPQEMLKLVQAGTTTFELPEVEVFNAQGKLIFHRKGLPDSFLSVLQKAIRQNKESNKMLAESLVSVVDYEGKVLDISAIKYDVAIVEYWADWCVPCKQQKKLLESYISKNENMKILWLKIEKDPSKVDEKMLEKH